MGDAAVEPVASDGLSIEDIDLLVTHQANARNIDDAARRLDLPREKVWVNLDRYGNTSAASVPMALAEAEAAGRLREGDNLVLVAFGAGLSWAAGVVRWGVAGVDRDIPAAPVAADRSLLVAAGEPVRG
jgi:3-oxoacyl-[acyl-carrier-protein] synthase-3